MPKPTELKIKATSQQPTVKETLKIIEKVGKQNPKSKYKKFDGEYFIFTIYV